MFAAALGYPLLFGVSLIFQKDTLDAGGTAANNMWIIWAIAFVAVILSGIVVEIIDFRKAI